MRKFLYVCVLAAGCTKPNPALSCDNGLCTDPTVPYCDVTGTLGGDGPNTCIHVSCTANEFAECRGDKAVTCNATGDNYDLLTCSQGCDATMGGCKPEPPCTTLDCMKHIIPQYLPTECNDLATNGDLTISASTSLDTSNDAMCTRVVQQLNGPPLCVVHYNAISIDRNQTLTVTGTRALALVADQTLLVDGILDVSASRSVSGPGGGVTVSGSLTNGAGGGGSGYRVKGGAGGSSAGDGGAANGGDALANPTGATYLIGGPRTDSGGGGGGVTLISCRGEVQVPGTVDAGGGGGEEEYIQGLNTIIRARGGGAGGTIVLQGMRLNVTGGVFANGGGGGGASGGGTGTPGEDGRRSTSPALGGLDGSGAGGTITGGSGGTKDNPGPGKGPAGGGGGAGGFLLAYTPSPTASTITPVAASPLFESTIVIATN